MSLLATHHQIEVQGLKTHFMRMGDGPKPVIMLHGWGGSTNSFFNLGAKLIAKRPDLNLVIVDYPGFGFTDFPADQAWDTYKYAEWVYDFMTTLSIPKSDFYIHSFGGRILVRLHEKHPNVINKMIFTGSAGIKWPLSVRQKCSVVLSKVMPKFKQGPIAKIQKFVVTKVFGARDWGNVKPVLKSTLKNVLAEPDVRDILPTIENEALLIWGAKDTITPLRSGNVFAQKLPKSELKVLPTGRHGIHHTHTDEIVTMVTQFL